MFSKIMNWLKAIVVSFFVMNIVTFLFYRPASEIKRQGAATPGIMYPNNYVLYGYEGYGISHIDGNGYPNTKTLRGGATNYILAVGSSHTEGFHVKEDEKWTSILENKLNKRVYNIAHSGYYLPEILKNFYCIINEFPNTEKIIIETDNLLFDSNIINECINQTEFDELQTYDEIVASFGIKEKILHRIKLNVPLLRWLNFQYTTIKNSFVDTKSNVNYNYEEILDSYRKVFKFIKNMYGNDIIIVYHPTEIIINESKVEFDNIDFVNLFNEICNETGIVFINMTNDFAFDYQTNSILHHGFNNTTLGSGHLNRNGNRLIAESIYATIGENNEN